MEKKRVLQFFSKAGYKLRPDSCDLIHAAYLFFEKADLFLNRLIETIQNIWNEKGLNFSTIIEANIVEEAIFLLKKEAMALSAQKEDNNIKIESTQIQETLNEGLLQNQLIICSNFDGNHLFFDPKSNQILLRHDKFDFDFSKNFSEFTIEKYFFLRSMIEKSPNYYFEHSSIEFSRNKIKISEIGSLKGVEGKFIIFGILFKSSGNFYLQDQLTSIKISISKCAPSIGYVNIGSYIIAEGTNFESIFIVDSFRFPEFTNCAKVEKYSLFKAAFHYSLDKEIKKLNFGNSQHISQDKNLKSDREDVFTKNIESTLKQKKNNFSVRIVNHFMLSKENMKDIEEFLLSSEYEGIDILILCGPFFESCVLRKSEEKEEVQRAIACFTEILSKLQNKEDGMLILFVPNVDDFGLQTFPKKEMSDTFFKEVKKVYPNTKFCQNPCNLLVGNRSFLISKTDLIIKALRNSVVPIDTEKLPYEHLAQNILGQRDLMPFYFQEYVIPPKARLKLMLYEVPDYLIICDDLANTNVIHDANTKYMIYPGTFLHSKNRVTIYPFLNRVTFE